MNTAAPHGAPPFEDAMTDERTTFSDRLGEARLFEILLGTALRRGETQDELVAFGYSADDIDHDTHKAMWVCMVELKQRSGLCDPAIVEAMMVDRGIDEQVARVFISDCLRDTSTVDGDKLRAFTSHLRQRVARRRIVEAARRIETAARTPGAAAAAIVAQAKEQLDGIVRAASMSKSMSGKELANLARAAISATTISRIRHKLGVPPLDDGGGWARGTVFLLGARSGLGKTTYGMHVAIANAREGVPTHYSSAEMPEDMMSELFAAALGGVDRRGNVKDLTGRARDLYDMGCEELHSLPLFFDYVAGKTAEEVGALIIDNKERHDLGVAVIDYMQKMKRSPGRFDRDESSHAHSSDTILRATEKANVLTVALCQVRKKDARPGTREDEEVLPSDSEQYLKDASGFADIYRDKMSKDPTLANLSRVKLNKDRYGFCRGGLNTCGYLAYADGGLHPCDERGAGAGIDFAKRAPRKRAAATPEPPKGFDDAPWPELG